MAGRVLKSAAAALLLITACLFSACDNPAEPGALDFDKMRADALELFNGEPGRDFAGYGYYTLMIGENYDLTAAAVTFPLVYGGKINGLYEVFFDKDGGVKHGNYIYNAEAFYERYKDEDGIFVVRGIYGSYILRSDGTLVYTGGIIELNESDMIEPDIFNTDFVRREYGVDISLFSNKTITEKNEKILKGEAR